MSLLKAAKDGSPWKCRQLLEAGSDVEERNKKGFTPLLLAAYFGKAEVCELLLEKGKVNMEEATPGGNTALKLAATEGHTSTVALLLSRGARVDTRNKDGCTPLLAAVQKGFTKVCKLLLAAGSDVREKTSITMFTPLHLAVIYGHEKIIQLLFSHKAIINSKNKTGGTPLLFASQQGQLASVVTLLQAGADPFLSDVDGSLPIHRAASECQSEVVRILIEDMGCSPDQVTHQTALQ